MAIYLPINWALVHVLPLSQLAGETLAVGSAARWSSATAGDNVVRVIAIICVVGAINAYHLMTSRIPVALARDRPAARRALPRVNAGGTPTLGAGAQHDGGGPVLCSVARFARSRR